MVVRGGEKALVGWATTKSGDTAPATVVDGSQTSHSDSVRGVGVISTPLTV